MSIDPAAVLALLSTLAQRVAQLEAENAALRAELADAAEKSSPGSSA